MIKKTIQLYITFVMGVLGAEVFAEETSVDYFVDLGMSNKEMELSIRDRNFEADFITLDLALTVAYGKYFASLSYEPSLKDDVRSDGSGLIFYSREDTTLTAGMSVMQGLSIFGGYRFGTTSSYYSAKNNESLVESEGLFGGVSYSKSFGEIGSAVVSLAIAQLSGTVTLNEPFVDRSTIPTAPDEVDGDALGYSFGLRWVGQLEELSSYNVGLKIHRYEFEDQENFGGLDLSFTENFTSVSAGITRYF